MQPAAVEAAVEAYCHELTKALSTCRQLQAVLCLLQSAASTLLSGLELEESANQFDLEGYGGLQQHWRQLHSLASEHGSWRTVKDCFYRRPFQEFGEVLLAVVGPDWRPSLTGEQDAALFLSFFRQAPAAAALAVLITHLSTVEVPDQPVLRGRATVTAVSAELACSLLEERFGDPRSPGLAQLLASITQQHEEEGSSSGSGIGSSRNSSTLGSTRRTSSCSRPYDQQQRLQLGAADEALAASLASIPDWAAMCRAPLLRPAAFVPQLVSRLLQWLQGLVAAISPGEWCQPTTSAAAEEPAVPHSDQPPDAHASGRLEKQLALAFCADLVSRLCKRGYAGYVAVAMWGSMQPAVLQQEQQAATGNHASGSAHEVGRQVLDVAASVVASMGDAAALEKLIEAFLRLVTTATSAQEGSSAHAGNVSEAHHSSRSSSGSSAAPSSEAPHQQGPSSQRGVAEPAGPSESPAQRHPDTAKGSPRASVKPLAREAIALAALRALLPLGTWGARPDVYYLLTDKLLTQRVLPSAALRCLVQYLDTVGSPPSRPRASRNASPADREDSIGGKGPAVRAERDTCGVPAAAAETGSERPGVDTLADVACQLARVWGDASSIQRLPLPRQAFLTAAVQECLGRLGGKRFQAHPDLLSAVLQGVGARLESPLPAVRRQGMRVGHSMSLLLDPAKPLFAEEAPWELLPQEQWEQAQQARQQGQQGQGQQLQGRARAQQAQHGKGQQPARRSPSAQKAQQDGDSSKELDAAAAGGGGKAPGGSCTGQGELEEDWPLTETDSDDDGLLGDGSLDDELAPYDLEESDEEDMAKSELQLRDLISLLRNSEKDWKGQLKALRSAEALIRAAPDELDLYGVPLVRALLHTPVPKWAAEEAKGGEEPADMQRFRSLVALVTEAPSRAGLALAADFYSPSMDIHHRDLLLTTLSAAAQELAHPGFFLQPLPGIGLGPLGDGWAGSTPGRALGSATAAVAAGGGDDGGGAARGGTSRVGQAAAAVTPAGASRAGRVTRVSERSLAAAKARAGPPAPSFVNRFPTVALSWAATLLRQCDLEHQGIDLFGRDSFLLGRLLITLGTFVECCKNAPQAVPLSTAVLELVKTQRVHAHPEPYVRRASLLAASQVMASLPPARLSSAMLGAVSAADPEDAALVSRLDWLRQWTDSTAEHDTDEGCRSMAASCRRLQASLAAGALAALDAGEGGSWGGTAAAGGARELLPAPKKGIQVALPQLEDLRLR